MLLVGWQEGRAVQGLCAIQLQACCGCRLRQGCWRTACIAHRASPPRIRPRQPVAHRAPRADFSLPAQVLSALQMAGRAGRRGYDTVGNCVILQARLFVWWQGWRGVVL